MTVPDSQDDPDAAAESLAHRAARLIATAILSGDPVPGATLPVEATLCRRLRVSRNALREAVKIVAAKGFVRSNRRGGTVVLPERRWSLLDPDVLAWTVALDGWREGFVAELAQLRAMVAPEVAALAARNATTTEILRLHEACDAMEQPGDDPGQARDAEVWFYRRLFEAAHGRLVASLLPAMIVLVRTSSKALRTGDVAGRLATYRAIADAVRARDPGAARDTTRRLAGREDGPAPPRVRVRAGRREVPFES